MIATQRYETGKYRSRILRIGVLLAASASLNACVLAPKWQQHKAVTAQMVRQTLDQPRAMHAELLPQDIPVLPVRVNLRPCCAFGTHLQASLGPLPVPFFSIGNIISVDDLGPHKYDSGAFSLSGSSTKNAFSSEKNGIIYTCRGGFIDTAHVRDYADWTLFWATTIARLSVTGGTVELPPEGGKRRVIIRPLPPKIIKRYGLRITAITLAQWLAFQMSIWHEIATAYGYASIEFYPEYVSAFSPEDMYSNQLGIKLAGGLLMQTGTAASDSLYDQSMDDWLRAALRYLGPVSIDAGKAATYLVDGVWWDSKARLPDPRLVKRRNLDIGTEIVPWQVSRAYSSPEMSAWLDKECSGQERPVVLQRSDQAQGLKFADFITLETDVDLPDAFPFPRAGSKTITQADFPAITEAVRTKALNVFGPAADRPERDAP